MVESPFSIKGFIFYPPVSIMELFYWSYSYWYIYIFLYMAYTLDYQSPFDKGSLVLSPGWSCGAISLV